MSAPIHGYERYERAKAFFAEAEYLVAARELEDFFTDVAAARAEQESTSYVDDPVGHGTAEVHLLLARAYFHSAQISRAEAAACEVRLEAPDDPYAHLLLGRTLQRAGRTRRGPPFAWPSCSVVTRRRRDPPRSPIPAPESARSISRRSSIFAAVMTIP